VIQINDIIIICDAGGGTTVLMYLSYLFQAVTDFGLFRIYQQCKSLIHLIFQPAIPPHGLFLSTLFYKYFLTTTAILGESIGSHLIDKDFENLVNNYLKSLTGQQYSYPEFSAESIAASDDFQIIKHDFGTPQSRLRFFKIDVPGLPRNNGCTKSSAEGLTIEEGKINVLSTCTPSYLKNSC
jgi:hypothetical protein